jgi:hypothetical protein
MGVHVHGNLATVIEAGRSLRQLGEEVTIPWIILYLLAEVVEPG